MALRNIVQKGDPILKKECRPVTKFNAKLGQLLDDMGETLLSANGLGLAGPQVGVMRRIFIALDERDLADAPKAAGEDGEKSEEGAPTGAEPEMDEDSEAAPPVILEFINPEIVEKEGEINGYEGCLSYPGMYGAIKRPQRVKVRAFDRYGEPFTLEAEEMLARCICHETDHLNGVTIEELAEYFYDPENPHELDEEMDGGQQQTEGDEE